MEKPIIGITMGDASGIGPEIIVKALSDDLIYEISRPLVIGDLKTLKQAARIINSSVQFNQMTSLLDALYNPGIIDCFHIELIPVDLPFGQVSMVAGHASYLFVEKAIMLALNGELDAICTAPLNKEALHLGGHDYPGHTEILAKLSGTKNYAMMFSAPKLNVILVTTHIGLIEAISSIEPQAVFETIQLANNAMIQLGILSPHIAVCGINPHAGEGGMFGKQEEEEKIQPAIERALNNNIRCTGPLPADTAFYRAVNGDFDIVVAMYHDQGLIPIKTISMETAVNITVGLPFIRTSVDHGTAFDIAGKGIADETNLKCAIIKAVEMITGAKICQP